MHRHLTGLIAAVVFCVAPLFLPEARAQGACGGLGQRACCAFEVPGVVLPRWAWPGCAWAIPERLQRVRRRHLHAAVADDVVRRRGPARLLA